MIHNEFFIFNANKFYDQENLENHLEYLDKEGGTPDMWDCKQDFETAKEDAIRFCESYHVTVVITNDLWEIIWSCEWNEEKQQAVRINYYC